MSDARETRGFQAEVSQLLKLMIHSLYSHREIFLRELISNASDANDKLRFMSLAQPDLLGGEPELGIWVEFDSKARTLTVRDNGIGMTREEAIAHLGTIAKSGTAEFFQRLTGDQQKDAQLIGQFGVGFYSAFIVADRVEVISRSANAPAAQGVRWESSAEGDYTVETVECAQRGTRVVLHLKDDAQEFADPYRLRALVRRYSDHIAFPVRMPREGAATLEFEVVNQAQALWCRPRSEVTDQEYRDFYRHISHDGADPLAWSHNRVEGKREYTSLLYVPAHAPFDLWQREGARGLKLYVRRVYIMDNADQFLPLYLRFIKGVADSSDLPLNVSRELLQQNADVEAMRAALTRRALDMLTKLSTDDKEKYQEFWKEFGRALKEGLHEDPANRDKLLPLLRFASTVNAENSENVSLADYVARLQPDQNHIYYLIADSHAAARHSPHLELLRKKGIEVLLLADQVDEWVMGSVTEFEGRKLKNVARGDLELGALASEADQSAVDAALKESKALLKRCKDALGERVQEVRPSARLTDSPACIVRGAGDLSPALRRMLAANGQDIPAGAPILELNVGHPLVKYLDSLPEGEAFTDLAALLCDEAVLLDEGALPQVAEFSQRLNRLLLRMTATAKA
jgi:molecular chaperone HtpG